MLRIVRPQSEEKTRENEGWVLQIFISCRFTLICAARLFLNHSSVWSWVCNFSNEICDLTTLFRDLCRGREACDLWPVRHEGIRDSHCETGGRSEDGEVGEEGCRDVASEEEISYVWTDSFRLTILYSPLIFRMSYDRIGASSCFFITRYLCYTCPSWWCTTAGNYYSSGTKQPIRYYVDISLICHIFLDACKYFDSSNLQSLWNEGFLEHCYCLGDLWVLILRTLDKNIFSNSLFEFFLWIFLESSSDHLITFILL